MHIRRLISVFTASALLAGAIGSCDAALPFSDTEIDEIEETLTDYLEAVQQSDFDAAKDYVEDEEEYFLACELDEQSAELITVILNETEFEIGDIEHDEDSASAQVTFTIPDIQSIAEEGYSFEEFVEAVPDIEGTVEADFEYDLNKDDDAWLIEANSTESICHYLTGLIADLEFGRLTEENALATVETFIGLMAEGNLTEANAMLTPNGNAFASYIATASVIPEMSDLLTSYCGRLTYTSEVTEVTDEYIIVTVSGTAPDLQAVIDAVIDNEEVMVPIYADYIEATANGVEFNYFSIAGSLLNAAGAEIDTAQIAPVEFEFRVTEDEDGELRLEVTGGPEFDVDMDALMSRTDYIFSAITQLLSEGRITLDQVLELREMYGV